MNPAALVRNTRGAVRVSLALALCAFSSGRAAEIVNIASASFANGPNNISTRQSNSVVAVRQEPPTASTLFIQKSASRATAQIGDFVDFVVQLKNTSETTTAAVVIDDRLPQGFVLVTGTTQLNGARVPDPRGGGGPDLQFDVGILTPGMTLTLAYRTRVGVEAPRGDGINRAHAESHSALSQVTSNVATARVLVQGGVFTERGVIFGKVFIDENRNRVQDEGELGIPGVRLYIEDGSYIITDSEGKYSFYGLTPHTHVVKVDRTTLPPGAKFEPLNTRHAGSGGSVFVELKNAEMHKANFAVGNANEEIIRYVKKLRTAAERVESGDFGFDLKRDLDRAGDIQPSAAADPRSLPAAGIFAPGVGVQPTTQDRTQSGDFFVLGGSRAPLSSGPGGFSSFPRNNFSTGNFAVSPSLSSLGGGTVAPDARLPGTASSQNTPALPTDNPVSAPVSTLPIVPLEQVTTAGRERFGFMDLKDGDTLPIAQTNVRVKSTLGGKLILRVNGSPVPDYRIGKRVADTIHGWEATEFIGISLKPGPNKLELLEADQFGNSRGSKTISVIAPDKLGRIKIAVPEDAMADGKTPARLLVELVDAHNVPVTARTQLTLEASLGKWLVADLNSSESGVQVFIEGGRAEYALAPPVEPGQSRVRISSGILECESNVSFLPELREMIAAGVVEGKINVSHLSASALRPTNSRDTFDSELRRFAVTGNDGSAAARAAFFIKGKILGNYLLTAAYDSEKDTRDRLFRDIQPDEFYPVYGDASVKGFEAQSTGQLYVRVDNKKSYLLYGDFVTQTPSDFQQLGNYSRSLNGVREHYETKNARANVWATYDNTRQVVEELRAQGTSGPYFFRTANGVVNSEKVEILTRDRNNPGLILKTSEMTRFSDYEFEPLTGRILFKAPVPSLDADLNPVSIRVTYEVDQGGDKFWVYGGDAQVKLNEHVQIGGTIARDENPLDHYGLYSGNAAYKVDEHTILFGEFAHSKDEILGSGNAERFELRHNSQNLAARIFWGRADEHFQNPTAILTPGRTEGGAQIFYQLSPNTRLSLQGVDSESQELGQRRGVLAGIEQTFGQQIRLELGGRYSTEMGLPASDSTALTTGSTSNEVRSLRTKLTLPVPWSENRAHVYGEYEQDVFDADKRLAAIGGEYQLDTKTRLYARTELISSLSGPFELNSAQQQFNSVVGVESRYSKDASLFNEYRVRDAITGRETEAAIGLRNLWTLADGLRATATFERIDPLKGADSSNKSTAITGGLEYTGDPDWKGTTRLELRTSQTVDSLLQTLGLAWKLNDNWTALGRSVIYLAHNKTPASPDQFSPIPMQPLPLLDQRAPLDQQQARVQAGLGWRQTDNDVWNALGKYEFRIEDGASGVLDGTDPTLLAGHAQREVHILSLDVNCQPNADWILSAHYAGKLAFEHSNDRNDTGTAHLVTAHVTHDLSKRLDVGLNTSAILSPDAGGSVQYAIGPEIGYTLTDDLRVGFGYNLIGFSDRDLTQDQYTTQGVYLALRFKFDEDLLHRGKEAGK